MALLLTLVPEIWTCRTSFKLKNVVLDLNNVY